MYLTISAIIIWCAFGVAIHGWTTLMYPLAWLGVAAVFLALNGIYDRRAATAKFTVAKEPSYAPASAYAGSEPEPVLN